MLLKNRVQISIAKRSGNVILRSDIANLGSDTQLSEVLRTLTQEGKLIKLGAGIYAKAHKVTDGEVLLVANDQQVAKELFERLGVEVDFVEVNAESGETIYFLDTSKRRMSRNLKFNNIQVVYSRKHNGFKNYLKIDLTTQLEMLPIKGVSDFVRRLAIQHGVIARRTRMDDWADAVTRLAGDDVKQDPTDELLVALTKKNIISGRQMVRLLTNHMKEEESVRSVQ
jgi:4-hydroxyphenylpyruvate dioxygenase-like putative hemolysin